MQLITNIYIMFALFQSTILKNQVMPKVISIRRLSTGDKIELTDKGMCQGLLNTHSIDEHCYCNNNGTYLTAIRTYLPGCYFGSTQPYIGSLKLTGKNNIHLIAHVNNTWYIPNGVLRFYNDTPLTADVCSSTEVNLGDILIMKVNSWTRLSEHIRNDGTIEKFTITINEHKFSLHVSEEATQDEFQGTAANISLQCGDVEIGNLFIKFAGVMNITKTTTTKHGSKYLLIIGCMLLGIGAILLTFEFVCYDKITRHNIKYFTNQVLVNASTKDIDYEDGQQTLTTPLADDKTHRQTTYT